MNKKLIKIGAALMTVIMLVSMFTFSSSAYIAYNTYEFNFYGEAMAAPSTYAPEKIYYGADLGVGSFDNPVDLYVSPQNELYVLDYFGTENDAKLHIFDSEFKHITTLTTLKANGNDYKMRLPESVTVDQYGYIYICDTGNKQVIKLDKDKSGTIVQTIGAPKTEIFSGEFKPSKVAIAKNMSLYVISTGTLDGIMEFNKDGVFLRYFGAPDVALTLMDMVTMAWRRVYRSIIGQQASDFFVTFVPTEFVNLVVDDYGFVYAVVASTGGNDNTNQLKKMNFLGNSVLDPNAKSTQKVSTSLSETYGDLVRSDTLGKNVFKDVAVDADGFITMMDANLGKIFEYDPEGNMTAIYGTKGKQLGLFQKPKAIAKLGKKTLVLDNYFGSITVFDLTKYGKTLHNGINLYDQGLYEEAENYWQEILKNNANCELAHIGIGKVYYQYGRYKEALDHFEIANDRMNYESAFALYRESLLAEHFDLLMTSLVVLVVLLFVWKFFGKAIINAIKEKKQGGGDDDTDLE